MSFRGTRRGKGRRGNEGFGTWSERVTVKHGERQSDEKGERREKERTTGQLGLGSRVGVMESLIGWSTLWVRSQGATWVLVTQDFQSFISSLWPKGLFRWGLGRTDESLGRDGGRSLAYTCVVRPRVGGGSKRLKIQNRKDSNRRDTLFSEILK